MGEQPLDLGTGLVSQDLVAGTCSCRLGPQDVLEESNRHLGCGRPEEDIEDVEVPWSPPFAPCGVPKIAGWVIQQVTVPEKWATGGQEATEANGKRARRGPSRRVLSSQSVRRGLSRKNEIDLRTSSRSSAIVAVESCTAKQKVDKRNKSW